MFLFVRGLKLKVNVFCFVVGMIIVLLFFRLRVLVIKLDVMVKFIIEVLVILGSN